MWAEAVEQRTIAMFEGRGSLGFLGENMHISRGEIGISREEDVQHYRALKRIA